MQCRMFDSMLGLYLLDTNSTYFLQLQQPKMSVDIVQCPLEWG